MENIKINIIVNGIIIFSILILLSLFIGSRDLFIGTDTPTYYKFFININHDIHTRISEPLFLILAKISYFFSPNFSLFTILISFISCLFYLLFYYFMLAKDNLSINLTYYIIFITFLFMLLSPFFWNSQLNVIRIGIAIPIFFVGSYFLYLNKLLKALLFFIASILFHFSMIMFIPFIFLVYLSEKRIIIIFILLSIFYLSGLCEIVFNIIADNLSAVKSFKYYLNNATNERGYKNGVRFDFYIFTLFFFLLSLKVRKYSKSSNYIFKLYTVLAFPFLIIGFINFSDRIIMISWSLIPILSALFFTKIIRANNLSYVITIPCLLLITILSMWYRNLI